MCNLWYYLERVEGGQYLVEVGNDPSLSFIFFGNCMVVCPTVYGFSLPPFDILKKIVITWFNCWGRRGHDHMIVRFTTTYAIGAYHHWCCDFESRSGRGVQHYVITFVSDLRKVGCFLRYLHQYNWPPRYNWIIDESGVKHQHPNKQKKLNKLSICNKSSKG
jgi:hypothetical protein